jgi:hypothetical protein
MRIAKAIWFIFLRHVVKDVRKTEWKKLFIGKSGFRMLGAVGFPGTVRGAGEANGHLMRAEVG